jgi:hypothetical protein
MVHFRRVARETTGREIKLRRAIVQGRRRRAGLQLSGNLHPQPPCLILGGLLSSQ